MSTALAGDAAGARDQLASLLPVRERVSGLLDPRTLADWNNFARWTAEAGDAGAAHVLSRSYPPTAQFLG